MERKENRNFFRRVFVPVLFVAVVVVMASFLTSCSSKSYLEGSILSYDESIYEYYNEDDYAGGDYIPGTVPTDAPENCIFSTIKVPVYRSKYFELSDTAKEIYAAMRECLMSDSLTFTYSFKNYSAEMNEQNNKDIENAFWAVYHDFPEFFWLNRNCGWEWNENGEYTVTVACYDYWAYTSNRKKYVDEVEKAVMALYNEASGCTTDYDKVKFVHDYLVNNIYYDDECLADINQTVQKASSQQAHTLYGSLVTKRAVCDGYAKAFQLITDMLGIQSEYIDGNTPAGGHAWNHLNLNGEEYWMDATWNDKDYQNEGQYYYENYIDYSYFCVNDDGFVQSHMPEGLFKIPRCTSLDDNYHVKNGYYLETYDFKSFCSVMDKQKDENYLTVRFANSSELEKAVNDIVGEKPRITEVSAFSSHNLDSGIYLTDYEMYTITFLFR